MFNFSLQTVLDVRERLEKIKFKEFSAVLLERQKLDEEIQEREEKFRGAGVNLDQVKQGTTTAMPMQLYDHFRSRLKSEIQLLQEQMREQEQALEEKRKELVEARRAHRALEILRDKEKKRYLAEANRQERAIMDEVAANHHLQHHRA